MNTQKINGTKIIWLSVLILFICVALTALAFIGVLNGFFPDDSGAISLIPEGAEESQSQGSNLKPHQSLSVQESVNKTPEESAEEKETQAEQESKNEASESPQSEVIPAEPGFAIEDGKKVWNTYTQVEIFRIAYENGERVITVQSNNEEKIIAPGTENSYTFKLKNTGNVALDYTVSVDAFYTPKDTVIPMTARMSRFDGKWIVGGSEEYSMVRFLDQAQDSCVLGAGKFSYYTIDWLWPFESGNDELDTMLGNLADEKEITFTVVIRTYATESKDPDAESGLTPPQTGDYSNIVLWSVVAGSAFAMVILLIFPSKKKKRHSSPEACNT